MQVVLQDFDGHRRTLAFPGKADISVGRSSTSDVILPSYLVSSLHARIARNRDGTFTITALGENATVVNDQPVPQGGTVRFDSTDDVFIMGYRLWVADSALAAPPQRADRQGRQPFNDRLRQLHEAVISRLDPRVFRLDSLETPEGRKAVYGAIRSELTALAFAADARQYGAREALRTTMFDSAIGRESSRDGESFVFEGMPSVASFSEARLATARRLASHLTAGLTGAGMREKIRAFREGFDDAFADLAHEVSDDFSIFLARWQLYRDLYDLIFGLGPLTDLLELPDVSEIMVVTRDQIYVEAGGVIEETGKTFVSDSVSERILEAILARVNRRVDKSSPMVDARLSDGSRLNAVIPPIALRGPCITIRRFSRQPLTIEMLVDRGSLDARAAAVLLACVRARKNIVVSGGTGSGKTTLLNALSAAIPGQERIVTVEDTAELQLLQRHVISLEARPANVENRGAVTIRDLVRNALRMRPDRLIVGECRGAEALDMLQAMNTGHDGSLTTGHANSPEDMLRRFEVMVLEAADMPVAAIRRQIASAIDVIVQLSRLPNGSRQVVTVSEVLPIDEDSGELPVQHILERRRDGRLGFSGQLPTFTRELIDKGGLVLDEVFA